MVHVEAHCAIQMGQGLTAYCAGVAFVSDEAAYHGTILLLYPRLVVLTVRPRACELDAPIGAVTDKCLVDERAVVVGVYAADRDREDTGDSLQSLGVCSRARSGIASGHPEHTSVTTRLCMNDPDIVPPQCATRSISR